MNILTYKEICKRDRPLKIIVFVVKYQVSLLSNHFINKFLILGTKTNNSYQKTSGSPDLRIYIPPPTGRCFLN